jgi:hypothetical protein
MGGVLIRLTVGTFNLNQVMNLGVDSRIREYRYGRKLVFSG